MAASLQKAPSQAGGQSGEIELEIPLDDARVFTIRLPGRYPVGFGAMSAFKSVPGKQFRRGGNDLPAAVGAFSYRFRLFRTSLRARQGLRHLFLSPAMMKDPANRLLLASAGSAEAISMDRRFLHFGSAVVENRSSDR